jgi:hypothetical protein
MHHAVDDLTRETVSVVTRSVRRGDYNGPRAIKSASRIRTWGAYRGDYGSSANSVRKRPFMASLGSLSGYEMPAFLGHFSITTRAASSRHRRMLSLIRATPLVERGAAPRCRCKILGLFLLLLLEIQTCVTHIH